MATFERDKIPGATIDYRFDWSSALGTDTIAGAVLTPLANAGDRSAFLAPAVVHR